MKLHYAVFFQPTNFSNPVYDTLYNEKKPKSSEETKGLLNSTPRQADGGSNDVPDLSFA